MVSRRPGEPKFELGNVALASAEAKKTRCFENAPKNKKQLKKKKKEKGGKEKNKEKRQKETRKKDKKRRSEGEKEEQSTLPRSQLYPQTPDHPRLSRPLC